MLDDYRVKYGQSDLEELAGSLVACGVVDDPGLILKTIELMVEAGSRYKNLEKSLGQGAIFVLGCKTSETM